MCPHRGSAVSEGTASSATMQAAACGLTAPGLPVPVASACPPLGLEQGARYWVLRWGERAGCGMGQLQLALGEGCGAGDTSDPSGHGWDRGCWHRAGLDGRVRQAKQRGAGRVSGCGAEAALSLLEPFLSGDRGCPEPRRNPRRGGRRWTL